MKTCTKCQLVKELTCFRKHSTNKDGLSGVCGECAKTQRALRESANCSTLDNKLCLMCVKLLPADQFLKNKSSKDGLNGWCRICTKDNMLYKKYNINLTVYNSMLVDQGYRCKLCFTDAPGGNRNVFVVDHDHKTGKVRSLLCNNCNTGIGKLKDDSQLLRRAAAYIDGMLR